MEISGSLKGKTALVTGAIIGIGFHTAEGLARLGGVVYITGRDEHRGQEAERQIRQAAGHNQVHFIQADASTVCGNQRLACQILALARRLEGSGTVANALHPGTAWTTMNQSSEPRVYPPGMRPFWPILRLIQRSGSPEKAARTSTFLASAPESANMKGQYFESSTPKAIARRNA